MTISKLKSCDYVDRFFRSYLTCMKVVYSLLIGTGFALDDSTMSLFAKVDPSPVASSFLQAEPKVHQALAAVPDQSYMPFSGIQFERPGTRPSMSVASNPSKRNKSFIRTNMVHLHDAPEGPVPGPVPDVFICYLAKDHNGLSARNCDMRGKNGAYLAQKLACSQRVNPQTVADLLMGTQTSPVDLTASDASTVVDSVKAMATPVSLQVQFGSCDSPRSDLPDSDLSLDYLVFVMTNPVIEAASENLALRLGLDPVDNSAFKAGVIMVGIQSLVGSSSSKFKSDLANNFMTKVATCADDSDCSPSELVAFVPSQPATRVDYYVGRSDGIVKILLEPPQSP